MISYAPLFRTMEKKGVTFYYLRHKSGFGGGTIQRIMKNMTVSTNTLDMLCKALDCGLCEIAEYIPDLPKETSGA